MFDEPFATGDTIIHRLDPRARLVAATLFSVVVAVSATPRAAAVALACACLVLAASRPRVLPLLKRLFVVNLFIAFLWLMLPFSTPGETVRSIGPLAATQQGIDLALLISLKSNAIVLAFVALVATADAATLGQAMYRLRLPGKLAFLFLFTYRFVQVVGEEFGRLRTAARLRGFVPRTSMHTYRTVAALLAMVLVKSHDRAQRVHQAMLLRGFSGRFVSLREFRFGPADAVFLGCMLALCAGVAVLDVLTRGAHG